MINVLMIVQYDGGNYCGWQRQANGLAVQEVLENALEKLLGVSLDLHSAGRTDAGVHALAMPCSFKVAKLHIPTSRLHIALNPLLPQDIRVIGAREAEESFHPRFDCLKKTYTYTIDNAEIPCCFTRAYAWHILRRLDVPAMQQAALSLVGKHDFSAFASSGGNTKSNIRTIVSINVERCKNLVKVSITGDGFLYNMVRIITGTLVEIGHGKQYDIKHILSSKDRSKAGQTAPPHGLALIEVLYAKI